MTELDPPPIPIPARVTELLHDYPELIEELRRVLDRYARKPDILQPFEGAIWRLEDTMDDFVVRARAEQRVAKASGDQDAIAKAEARVNTMFRAGSLNGGLKDLDVIHEYFAAHRGST